jgi:hypothetical protein
MIGLKLPLPTPYLPISPSPYLPFPTPYLPIPMVAHADPPNVSPTNPAEPKQESFIVTVNLALQDAKSVLDQQQQFRQLSLTQLNILFVTNTALLTVLSISRLLFTISPFSVLEIVGFFFSFSVLIYAVLPRQPLVTPNLEDPESLEYYLSMSPDEYRLQMLTNFVEVYKANKQRLDDITQALSLATYIVWGLVIITLSHVLAVMLFAVLSQKSIL